MRSCQRDRHPVTPDQPISACTFYTHQTCPERCNGATLTRTSHAPDRVVRDQALAVLARDAGRADSIVHCHAKEPAEQPVGLGLLHALAFGALGCEALAAAWLRKSFSGAMLG